MCNKPIFVFVYAFRELHAVGIRLNCSPPEISLTRKKGGGININSIVPLTKVWFECFVDRRSTC
jgi:ribosome-interacting GTPase 1